MIRKVRVGMTIHQQHAEDAETLCGLHLVGDGADVARWLPATCAPCRVAAGQPQYAFCETVGASGRSRIHIRILGPAGKKPNGGADTPALCGADVAWDVPGLVDGMAVSGGSTCPACRFRYRRSSGQLGRARAS